MVKLTKKSIPTIPNENPTPKTSVRTPHPTDIYGKRIQKTTGNYRPARERFKEYLETSHVMIDGVLHINTPNSTVIGPTNPNPTARNRPLVEGGAIARVPHATRAERRLADKVMAHGPDGRRIFAYNAQGVPICYCLKNGRRCQSPWVMFNGRCKMHGGNNKKGAEHYNAKHLRTADTLPVYLHEDARKAAKDPDLLSLNHELELCDVLIADLKRNLDMGLSESATKRIASLFSQIFKGIEKEELEYGEDEMYFINELYSAWTKGRDREVTRKKINDQVLVRDKLTNTMHRREKDLNLMIRHDQATALVVALAAACREGILEAIDTMEKRYILIDRNELRKRHHLGDQFALLDKFLEENDMMKAKSQRIDPKVQEKFLAKCSSRLGSLINQTRPIKTTEEEERERANEDAVNAEFTVHDDDPDFTEEE